MVKFYCNILSLHGGVYSNYGVETLWSFCPRIFCALVPLAWARFSLFSPNPAVNLLQPLCLACHFHTLKMEAQCFREVLVSTDETV
jgi:hypothetical protein